MSAKIMLVDDHTLFRSWLKKILMEVEGLEVLAEASTSADAIQSARRLLGSLDLIILDISLPDQDGISAAEEIRKFDPRTPILFVTMHKDKAYLREAMSVGADGFISKQAVDEELLAAVRAILNGQKYVHPVLAAALFDAPSASDAKGPATKIELSKREEEVLRYLALGYTQREIGELLYISEKTVETYKGRLMQKLDARKRSDLVKYAFEHGIAEV